MKAESAPSGAGRSTGTIGRIGTISAPRSVESSARSFTSRNISSPIRSALRTPDTRINRTPNLQNLSVFRPNKSAIVNEGPVKGFSMKNTVEFSVPKITAKKDTTEYKPIQHRIRPRRSARLHSVESHKPHRNTLNFHKKSYEIPQGNKPNEFNKIKNILSAKDSNEPLNILAQKVNSKNNLETKIQTVSSPSLSPTKKQINYKDFASMIVPDKKVNAIPKQSVITVVRPEISENIIAVKKQDSTTSLIKITEIKKAVRGKIAEIRKSITKPEAKLELSTGQKLELDLNTKNEISTKPAVKSNEIVVFKYEHPKKSESSQDNEDADEHKKFEADSKANHARLSAILNAWSMAMSNIKDYKSILTGFEIVKYLPSKPDESLISELAREVGKKSDGSYDEVRSTLSVQGKIEKIGSIAHKIIEMIPAVRRRKKVTKSVTKKDVLRVILGEYSKFKTLN